MKRLFDVICSICVLLIAIPVFLICIIGSLITTQTPVIFKQIRIGQYSKPFYIYKFCTIHPKTRKISKFSAVLRKYKLDELPQLINVLKGDMSFVGPRPDIPGYYDKLQGEQRKILNLKPGLTCEASLKYWNEEQLLAKQDNPKIYNDTVIFPDKVSMNLQYYHNRSFLGDLKIIFKTIVMLASLLIGKSYFK